MKTIYEALKELEKEIDDISNDNEKLLVKAAYYKVVEFVDYAEIKAMNSLNKAKELTGLFNQSTQPIS